MNHFKLFHFFLYYLAFHSDSLLNYFGSGNEISPDVATHNNESKLKNKMRKQKLCTEQRGSFNFTQLEEQLCLN